MHAVILEKHDISTGAFNRQMKDFIALKISASNGFCPSNISRLSFDFLAASE